MSQDPHFKREQQKYENPVASREYLLQILTDKKQALSFMDICHLVNANDEDSRVGIQRRLRAMEREGQILFNRQKKYEVADQSDLIKGRIIGHRDGFGFLAKEGGGKDLFIPIGQMQIYLPGDLVLAKETNASSKGRTEAKIVRLLEPRAEAIVGRFHLENGVGIVVPDDSRICQEIFILDGKNQGARQGNVVVVEIIERPRHRRNAVGKVIEVLGDHMAPGMEIEMALRTFDIPHQWPQGVKRQIKKLSETVEEKAKVGRIDLRDMPLVTIDGEDARDFDDAVFCQLNEAGGWTLWVAIADVSYYVRTGTALDDEAQNRGTSVYFPDQVIPMLPEALSNGLCSLNPDVDRLCMTCEMSIDAKGKLEGYRFYEAVMNSKARLTYTKVAAILEGDPELHKRYQDFVPHLRELYSLFKVLRKARQGRGAIEFETQESKFVFDAQRKIDYIVPVVRNDAHKLIEECMIMANVATASFLQEHKAEGLYRIHDEPDADRLLAFKSYLSEVGIQHGLGDDVTPGLLGNVLSKVGERPDQELIQTMLLRSMKQAVYDRENIGHFGLALEAYAHFTSPIRRYPDLIVHRAIKAVLKKKNGEKTQGAKSYSVDEVEALGESCSMAERRADDATRDVSDWLKCEFMQDHVGDSFDGVIASVTNFGFFVRLTEFHIDGLVHITSLDNDYYHYDEVKQRLVGESRGVIYRLGDELSVKVASVNLDDRKIDFILDLPDSNQAIKKHKKNKSRMTNKGSEKSTSNRGTSTAPKRNNSKRPAKPSSRSKSKKSKGSKNKPASSRGKR
jgi:ribonuclease R